MKSKTITAEDIECLRENLKSRAGVTSYMNGHTIVPNQILDQYCMDMIGLKGEVTELRKKIADLQGF